MSLSEQPPLCLCKGHWLSILQAGMVQERFPTDTTRWRSSVSGINISRTRSAFTTAYLATLMPHWGLEAISRLPLKMLTLILELSYCFHGLISSILLSSRYSGQAQRRQQHQEQDRRLTGREK